MGKLKVGDKAPLFKAESYNKGSIDLEEWIGKGKIVIIFSRYFGCPICQLDFKELIERLPELEEKGAKIIFITQSSEKIAQERIREDKITFPVIQSPQEDKKTYTLYKSYELGMMNMATVTKVPGKLRAAKKAGFEHGEYEGWEKQIPGQFVIDEKGVLIHARKGWLDIDKILEVL